VLRDAGFVSCRIAAQHRITGSSPARCAQVDDWLAPYRPVARHLTR
jgi:hypothetical protein